MTLAQLRYLVAIADAGLNITLAAERVHVTQPGLSKQLRQLEQELAVRLFVRKGKSLAGVTHAGRRVLEHARKVLAETSSIRAIAANLQDDAQGELRIATTHTQARFVLPRAIGLVSQRYPRVRVHLHPCRDADVLHQLGAGHADMAVVSTTGAPPTAGVALPAYRWRRVVLLPRDHPPASRRKPLTLAELARLPLISYESSMLPESSLQRAFNTAGLQPNIAMTAGDADLIKTYVRAGMGVGVLAEMAMSSGDTDLKVLPADHLFPPCTTWIVLPRQEVLRDHVLEFVRQLAPHLEMDVIEQALRADGQQPHWPDAPCWQEWHPAKPPVLEVA